MHFSLIPSKMPGTGEKTIRPLSVKKYFKIEINSSQSNILIIKYCVQQFEKNFYLKNEFLTNDILY